MTLKELLEQYNHSDSVKERDELEDKICNFIEKFVHDAQTIAEKYDTSYFGEGTDYRLGRGNWNFKHAYKDCVVLSYEDYWRYGGYCNEQHSFTIKDIDDFCPQKYEKTLIKKKMTELRRDVNAAKNALERAEEKMKQFKESCQQK